MGLQGCFVASIPTENECLAVSVHDWQGRRTCPKKKRPKCLLSPPSRVQSIRDYCRHDASMSRNVKLTCLGLWQRALQQKQDGRWWGYTWTSSASMLFIAMHIPFSSSCRSVVCEWRLCSNIEMSIHMAVHVKDGKNKKEGVGHQLLPTHCSTPYLPRIINEEAAWLDCKKEMRKKKRSLVCDFSTWDAWKSDNERGLLRG